MAENHIQSLAKEWQDAQTRQWVIEQIRMAEAMVVQAIEAGEMNLNTLALLDNIINPVRQFYGLETEQGLKPLLTEKLTRNTDEIVAAFNSLPITEATVPATEYFVNQVKTALGVS